MIPQILKGLILKDKVKDNNSRISKPLEILDNNTHSNSVPLRGKLRMLILNLFKRRLGYGMRTSYPHLHLSYLVNPTHPSAAQRVNLNPES